MTEENDVLVVVEDNPSDLELTIRALKRSGFKGRVISLRDGAEALDFLFQDHDSQPEVNVPKVIFLDLKLPKVTGLEVLRKIRAEARTRWYPVVILTSSKEECDVKEAYRLGVNSYIVKPVNFEKFSSTIRALSEYWLFLNQCPFRYKSS